MDYKATSFPSNNKSDYNYDNYTMLETDILTFDSFEDFSQNDIDLIQTNVEDLEYPKLAPYFEDILKEYKSIGIPKNKIFLALIPWKQIYRVVLFFDHDVSILKPFLQLLTIDFVQQQDIPLLSLIFETAFNSSFRIKKLIMSSLLKWNSLLKGDSQFVRCFICTIFINSIANYLSDCDNEDWNSYFDFFVHIHDQSPFSPETAKTVTTILESSDNIGNIDYEKIVNLFKSITSIES